jgi:bacillithiol biosynthesis cysteine-adding enzyme BshC
VSLHFESTALSAATPPTLAELAGRRPPPMATPLRDAFVAHDRGADRLAQLLAGAACVTTGQQPGLLTGPLFTVYKALTAVALAEVLERQRGQPVVPVFWVAGDDHDFAEANHVHYLTLENELERVVLREREPSAPLTPLYREPLGSEVARVLAELVAQSPNTEFRGDVLAWLERHYRSDRDFATAFAGSVAELLGRFGLVVLRPTSAAAKQAMASHLLRALRSAGDIDRALDTRAAVLRDTGRPAPVPVGDGATLVMIEGKMGRDRLVLDGERFAARRSGESWTLTQLERLAEDEPRRLSPNVLLRPVVEASLLPTLAYVAGPGELDYLPQCEPVYAALGVEPQLPFPRWSAQVVEPRVSKVLGKYTIAPEDLRRTDLESRLVRDDMPESVRESLHALRVTLGQQYQELQGAASAVDPTLKKSVQSARNSALSELASLEKRIIAHLKKQNEIVVQQIGKARNNLFPQGQPQERMLTVAPYLVRYGFEFLDAALEEATAYVSRAVER